MMKHNVAVFVLFFGLALVEALQSQNWLKAGIFAALGMLLIWADIQPDINNKLS